MFLFELLFLNVLGLLLLGDGLNLYLEDKRYLALVVLYCVLLFADGVLYLHFWGNVSRHQVQSQLQLFLSLFLSINDFGGVRHYPLLALLRPRLQLILLNTQSFILRLWLSSVHVK